MICALVAYIPLSKYPAGGTPSACQTRSSLTGRLLCDFSPWIWRLGDYSLGIGRANIEYGRVIEEQTLPRLSMSQKDGIFRISPLFCSFKGPAISVRHLLFCDILNLSDVQATHTVSPAPLAAAFCGSRFSVFDSVTWPLTTIYLVLAAVPRLILTRVLALSYSRSNQILCSTSRSNVEVLINPW